jgi:hypothetical protein
MLDLKSVVLKNEAKEITIRNKNGLFIGVFINTGSFNDSFLKIKANTEITTAVFTAAEEKLAIKGKRIMVAQINLSQYKDIFFKDIAFIGLPPAL